MTARKSVQWLAASGAILALAACAPPEESGGSDSAAPAETASTETPTPSANVPLSESGWLTVGEDGAVYTTFLDAGGTYRDFRNGSPMQSGTWARREDGRLCFVPEAVDRVGACWRTGKVSEDGTMRATNSQGRAIELKRVTYLAPPAAEAETEETADTAEEG